MLLYCWKRNPHGSSWKTKPVFRIKQKLIQCHPNICGFSRRYSRSSRCSGRCSLSNDVGKKKMVLCCSGYCSQSLTSFYEFPCQNILAVGASHGAWGLVLYNLLIYCRPLFASKADSVKENLRFLGTSFWYSVWPLTYQKLDAGRDESIL
jgi:hypothetical protein